MPDATPPEERVQLGDIVEQLKPYIPDMIKTIGIAASATTNADGKLVPGDIKAASIGLDLIVKHLTGTGSSRIDDLLAGLRAARQDDSPATG